MASLQFSFTLKNSILLILVITFVILCAAHNEPSNPNEKAIVEISSCIKVCESAQSLISQLLQMHGLSKVDVNFLNGCGSALVSIKDVLNNIILVLRNDGGAKVGTDLKALIGTALSLTNSCDTNNKSLNPELVKLLNKLSWELEGSAERALGRGVINV